MEVRETLIPAADIIEKMAECYQITVEKMIKNLSPESSGSVEGKNLHDIVMANEPTVINLVKLIISEAIRERASDIHKEKVSRDGLELMPPFTTNSSRKLLDLLVLWKRESG